MAADRVADFFLPLMWLVGFGFHNNEAPLVSGGRNLMPDYCASRNLTVTNHKAVKLEHFPKIRANRISLGIDKVAGLKDLRGKTKSPR